MSPIPPRRQPTNLSHVTQSNTVQTRLLADYARLGTWQAVGRKYGVSRGMAYRVAVQGYEPKRRHIRFALSFPTLHPAPVCPVHGVVHLGRCPRPRPMPKSLWDWPVRALARALRERVAISGGGNNHA